MHSSKCAFLLLLIILTGCGQLKDDLLPSGSDKRPAIQQGTTGPAVGQHAPDFTATDTHGNSVALSPVVPERRATVLYFTMWCPTCDTHMSYMRDALIAQNPDVLFFAVDYVSGSVAEARNGEVSNGYDNSGFIVLADVAHTITDAYNGTMGSTVVIDGTGIVRMNEDFKIDRLQDVLRGLQQAPLFRD